MRYAILSDIHSNLGAFQAVINDMEGRGRIEDIWCLGDVVGYGPEPNECIQLLRQYRHVCVLGNHDWASLGKLDISQFNPDAAAACRWTAEQLDTESKTYLENLSQILYCNDFTLVHGSPREPIWEYLLSTTAARVSFRHFDTAFCLVGHSHVPLIFEYDNNSDDCTLSEFPLDVPFQLGKKRAIINPGGVGQPRDGDPRASYAIYDNSEMLLFHYRVPYDIASTQQKMIASNLPTRLAARLSYGW